MNTSVSKEIICLSYDDRIFMEEFTTGGISPFLGSQFYLVFNLAFHFLNTFFALLYQVPYVSEFLVHFTEISWSNLYTLVSFPRPIKPHILIQHPYSFSVSLTELYVTADSVQMMGSLVKSNWRVCWSGRGHLREGRSVAAWRLNTKNWQCLGAAVCTRDPANIWHGLDPLEFRSKANCLGLLYGSSFSVSTTLSHVA